MQDYNKMRNLIGIDEAGRGALAGPLFMGACLLKGDKIEHLKDSKKLSALMREKLYTQITAQSSYLILSFSHTQIDEKGLSWCLKMGLWVIKRHFTWLKNALFLYDGNTNFKEANITTLVKADSKVEAVSAASILAKVSRDEVMKNLAKIYDRYGFEKHKGYGSKAHIEAILKYGTSQIHRKSFKLKQNEYEEANLFSGGF